MIKKYKDKMLQWLRNRPGASLGIATDEQRAYMVLVERNMQGVMEIAWQDTVEIDCIKGLSGEAPEDNMKYDALLESAAMRASQNCRENVICSLALAESEVFYYEKFFPEMNSREMKQAVRLDFAATAAWQEKFYCSFQSTGQGMLRIAGIQKRNLERRLQVLRREYPWSQAVLVCRDGLSDTLIQEMCHQGKGVLPEEHEGRMQAAVYAGVCGLAGGGIVFRTYGEYLCRWNWLHASQAVWGIAMIAVAMFWGTAWYIQQDMDNQITKAESRLHLMQDIDERERQIAADRQVVEQKNKLLAQLEQGPRIGQGLLVRLGQGIEDDVWITGLKALEDGTVSIQGRGSLYGHISAMMDNLNRHKAGSENPLTLENADMAQDGRIDFRIRGRV